MILPCYINPYLQTLRFKIVKICKLWVFVVPNLKYETNLQNVCCSTMNYLYLTVSNFYRSFYSLQQSVFDIEFDFTEFTTIHRSPYNQAYNRLSSRIRLFQTFCKRFVNVQKKTFCFGANIRSKLDVLQTFFKRLLKTKT